MAVNLRDAIVLGIGIAIGTFLGTLAIQLVLHGDT